MIILSTKSKEKINFTKTPHKPFLHKTTLAFSILSYVFVVAIIVMLAVSQLLPLKYLLPFCGIIAIISTLNLVNSFRKKLKKVWRIVSIIFSFILILFSGLGIYYLIATFNFFDKIKPVSYRTENYQLIVLKDSDYEGVEDLANREIGIYQSSSESYHEAEIKLEEVISYQKNEYHDSVDAASGLLLGETDAILLNEAYTGTINELLSNFTESTRVIYSISISVENTDVDESENIDVTTQPFSIFISGIDVDGDISTVSRSDVNMIVTVNPNTYQILLTSIPRDYYVKLYGTDGSVRDKLTHAGLYGINTSIKTIEDFMGIDINYYVRVNFTSVVKLVNAIGGITIYSDTTFSRSDSHGGICYYYKGDNDLNGYCALRFARERKIYYTGDLHRILNQQQVITGIIKKMTNSPAILTDYSNILDSMVNNLETNIEPVKIYSLVNLQLNEMPSWTISNYSLSGEHIDAPTYTMGEELLYVFEPDLKTIETGREKIEAVLRGENPEDVTVESEVVAE